MREPKSNSLFTLILVLSVLLPCRSFAQAPHGQAPHPPHVAKPHSSVFPRYQSPPHSAGNAHPNTQHADHFGNRVSPEHEGRVSFANTREHDVMRPNPAVNHNVGFHSNAYRGALHPIYQNQRPIYVNNVNHFHTIVVEHPVVWHDWHEHYFYGGFFWGFHPVPDVSVYYYNPLVHWFYVPVWDDTYYRTWYGAEYSANPELNRPFPYYGVFYPTENLRQLLFAVSAMPVSNQANFRSGMITMTQNLTQNLANYTHAHVTLKSGDLILTHYETLNTFDGVAMEGSINSQNKTFNFKSLVYLASDHAPQVFLAGDGSKAPTAEQLKQLDELNDSITNVRGAPEQKIVEADPAKPLAEAPKGDTQAPTVAGSTPSYPANQYVHSDAYSTSDAASAATPEPTPEPTATPASGEVSADPK